MRPAGGARGRAGDRYLDLSARIRAIAHEQDAGELEPAARARRRPSCAARGRLRVGRRGVQRRRRDLTDAFAGLDRRGDDGPRRPPTRCSPCSPPTPASSCSWAPAGSAPTSAASAAGRAASGSPSARTRRELERELAEHGVGCVLRRSDRDAPGTSLDHLEPVATRPAPVAVPVDWETIGRVWDPGGYPAGAPTATRTGARATTWQRGQRRSRLRPSAHSSRRGARRPRFVARALTRLDAYRAERARPGLAVLRAGHRAARRTSGTRARAGSRRDGRGAPQGLALATLPARPRAPWTRRTAARPRRAGGLHSDLDLGLTGSGRARLRARRRVAGGRGRRGSAGDPRPRCSAPPASCSPPSRATGRSGLPRDRRRVPVRALPGPPGRRGRGARRSADSASVPEPSVRDLAPGLDLGPLLRPRCRAGADTARSPRPGRRRCASCSLGVPAADRGRAGPARAQAGRGPGGRGRRGRRADPRPRGVAARGGGRRRGACTACASRAPERARRVRHLGGAHERRHARRGRRARRPLRLRRGARPRLAGRGGRRRPGAALSLPARGHHRRDRVRAPPGPRGRPPAVAHPLHRALAGQRGR